MAGATASLDAPMVLDLGANDGRFSRVAVDAGASLAVAVDGDHLVVDHLYRALRAEGERRILPLVLDLADPSPALGWRSRERPSFVERVRPDLVLCLAVIHHLALSNTVPFDEIVAFLHDFGGAARGRDAPSRRPDGRAPAGSQADRGVRPLRPPAVGDGARQAVRRARAGDPPLGHPHAVPLPPALSAAPLSRAAAGRRRGPAAAR